MEFDLSTVGEPVPTIEEIVKMARFDAYDKNGKQESKASLYIEDYKDMKIIKL